SDISCRSRLCCVAVGKSLDVSGPQLPRLENGDEDWEPQVGRPDDPVSPPALRTVLRSKPLPRHGYKPSPPNGCGSPLFGVNVSTLDVGIPSVTRCCDRHDRCYDTCGRSKGECDREFRACLSEICRELQKTLGFSRDSQACESTMELLFDGVIHLGCKPYLDGQRAACTCLSEQKTDL
uniref:Group XIIA secretory phospholipase A2 n=1 Tax=Ornithorhynchus anatinus TaxID=9258 RepID=A0A6I8P555_ORNAN